MLKNCLFISCIFLANCLSAQKAKDIIRLGEVERIERTLSADDMEGRRTGTPGIEKAAAFISTEMKAAGLQTLPGNNSFFQSFSTLR